MEFINKDYIKLVTSHPHSRLNEDEVECAIFQYKGKITPAPESYYETLKPIEISGTEPPEYFIDFDLWFDDRHSDLTASFHIVQKPKGKYQAVLEDLHTL